MSDSTVRVIFRGDSGSAVAAVRRLEGSFSGMGRNVARGVGLATKAVGVGLVAALAASAKAAITFDREMRNVNSLAKLSQVEYDKLSKRVLALAKDTGQAPKVLAQGLYDIVSSGFEANDAMKILHVSARAAAAGMTTTAVSAKAIDAALNAYGQSADQARHVSDVLFQTVKDGVLNFEELSQQMGDLVPASSNLKIPLENVGAAMAQITLQGVPAAEAATRVKNGMIAIAAPGKALKALFKEQGYESGQAAVKAVGYEGVLKMVTKATHGNLAELHALFPEQRAFMGMLGLTGKNLEHYNELLDKQRHASDGAGATAKAYAEQVKSISVQWDKAKAALVAAAVPIGKIFFPALSQAASAAQKVAEWIEKIGAKSSTMGKIKFAVSGIADFARDVVGKLRDALMGTDRTVGVSLDRFIVVHKDGLIDKFNQAFQGVDWSSVGRTIAQGMATGGGMALAVADGIGRALAGIDWSHVASQAGPLLAEAMLGMVTTLLDPAFWLQHLAGLATIIAVAFPLGRVAALLKVRWLEALTKVITVPVSGIAKLIAGFFSEAAQAAAPRVAGAVANLVKGLKPGPLVAEIKHMLQLGARAAGQEVGAWAAAGTRLAGRLIGAIDTRLGQIAASVASKVGAGGSAAAARVGTWAASGAKLAAALVRGVVGGLASIAAQVISKVAGAASGAGGRVGAFSGAGAKLAAALISGVVGGLAALGSQILNAITSAISYATSHIPTINVHVPVHFSLPSLPSFHMPRVGARGGELGAIARGHPAYGLPAFARGGMVDAPTILVGEEPGHPEFVIPTNPNYRTRAKGILHEAARAIGARMMARGGATGNEMPDGPTISPPTQGPGAVYLDGASPEDHLRFWRNAVDALDEALYNLTTTLSDQERGYSLRERGVDQEDTEGLRHGFLKDAHVADPDQAAEKADATYKLGLEQKKKTPNQSTMHRLEDILNAPNRDVHYNVRDEDAIGKRLMHLDELVALKVGEKNTLDAEAVKLGELLGALQMAVEKMNAAIAVLSAAMQAQQAAAAHAAAEQARAEGDAERLAKEAESKRNRATDIGHDASDISGKLGNKRERLASIDRQIREEEGKKHPDKARLGSLRGDRRDLSGEIERDEDRVTGLRADARQLRENAHDLDVKASGRRDDAKDWGSQHDAAESAASALSDRIDNLAGARDDFQSRTRYDSSENQALHAIPSAKADIDLDIGDLLQRKTELDAMHLPGDPVPQANGTVGQYEDTPDDTSTGGSSGGSGGSAGSVDTGLLDELRRQVSQLRLALGIQAAQMPILGSFRRGVLHVPRDGVAMLHAGEQVLTPGHGRDTASSGDGGQVSVNVHFADGMEWLEQFVRAEVDGSTRRIALNIGREADRQRRVGGY